MKPVIFLPGAEKDFFEALQFYRASGALQSKKFRQEVNKAVGRIKRFPRSAIRINSGIRKVVLRIYPYSLIYRINEKEINIIAVAHQSRHPDYWKERIP